MPDRRRRVDRTREREFLATGGRGRAGTASGFVRVGSNSGAQPSTSARRSFKRRGLPGSASGPDKKDFDYLTDAQLRLTVCCTACSRPDVAPSDHSRIQSGSQEDAPECVICSVRESFSGWRRHSRFGVRSCRTSRRWFRLASTRRARVGQRLLVTCAPQPARAAQTKVRPHRSRVAHSGPAARPGRPMATEYPPEVAPLSERSRGSTSRTKSSSISMEAGADSGWPCRIRRGPVAS